MLDWTKRWKDSANESVHCRSEAGRGAFHRVAAFAGSQGRGGTRPYHFKGVYGGRADAAGGAGGGPRPTGSPFGREVGGAVHRVPTISKGFMGRVLMLLGVLGASLNLATPGRAAQQWDRDFQQPPA